MSAIIIGAGIAGSALAYFLSQKGLSVTVLDVGRHAASHVPVALLNPVRGQSGQLPPRALEGLALTWQLIEDLSAAGHRIPHARCGVHRPVPDEQIRRRFEAQLPPELEHRWLTPEFPLKPRWEAVLSIPSGGWVDGAALVEALLIASGARRLCGRAERWNASEVRWDGKTLSADLVCFCGGSLGSTWAGRAAVHRQGTVLRLSRCPNTSPLSFGAYLSPGAEGAVLGGTFEAPSPVWRPPQFPTRSLQWLLNKGEALVELRGLTVQGQWTGSRLSERRLGVQPDGSWELSGLGSKGFLLGPLLARDLTAQMVNKDNPEC